MNNFDCSSSGINLEFSCFRDNDLSRLYFEEAFIRDGDQLIYTEGNFSEWEKEYTFTLEELKSALIDQLVGQFYALDELKADVKDHTGESWSKVKKQELVDYLIDDYFSPQCWLEFCQKAGFNPNFDIVISRGYCQGDYKEVIIPHKFWECIGVKKPECVQSNLGDTIANLLWDSPIYCRLTINDEEYFIDQDMADCYNWDKSEALVIAEKQLGDDFTAEQKAYIMAWLVKNLPDCPDYQ